MGLVGSAVDLDPQCVCDRVLQLNAGLEWQLTLTLNVCVTGVAAERWAGGALARGAGGAGGERQVDVLPGAVPSHQPPQLQALRPRPLQRRAHHRTQRRLPEHSETEGQLPRWLAGFLLEGVCS